jgi:CubicO group peptidase (beta-lactamase class C family)
VERPLTLQKACDWAPVVDALALQSPLWTPGSQYAYHAFTFGYLVGEVVRRATGRTIGSIFAEDVARPLELDAWIGSPEEVEGRVAVLEPAPDVIIDDPQLAALVAKAMGPDSVMARALTLGGAVPPGFVTEAGGMNARMVRASEWPAANLVSDARSIAKMYAATVGEVDGVRLLTQKALAKATTPQTDGQSPFGVPEELAEAMTMRFGLGYMLPSAAAAWLSPSSFGHVGAGGALGFGDREFGIGFGYVMNQMQIGIGDPRTLGLIDAVRAVVAARA